MDDSRFSRLENRVDEIKDDVSEVKAEQKLLTHTVGELGIELKEHTKVVRDHVTGDDKIITEIQPLLRALPHLTEVIENYQFEKEQKRRKRAKRKDLMLKLGIPSTLIAIFGGIAKIFLSL